MATAFLQYSQDAICRNCGYPLVGLPSHRCPECGGDFDPADPRTFLIGQSAWFWHSLRTRLRIIAGWWVRVGSCAGVSWLLYEYSEGRFSSLFWTPAIYLAVRRKWIGLLIFVMLTPYTFLLLARCHEYAVGSSRYVRDSSIYIATPYGSIDPRTRVRGHDPGCGTRSGNWWLERGAERQAIQIMHALQGPPPGAYTGPYPTQSEAVAMLRTGGQKQRRSILDDGRVQIGKQQFNVEIEQLRWRFEISEPDLSAPTATLFQQQCLIVRVPRDLTPKLAVIYLFDIFTGRAFAIYWDDTTMP
jgi:hypothetical protein